MLDLGTAAAVLGLLAVSMMMRAAGDADLVSRLQARDARAMAEIYDRFGRQAYSVILRIVHNPSIAEDLVQETFLRVWSRVSSFDGHRGVLGAWILTVARNRAIDHLRSIDGRMQNSAVELNKLENTSLFADLPTDALTLDRARRLKAALEKLTPSQRQVIDLAYYEGLSQTEMAERMKQPLGTVKTWTRSALQILRDQLAGVAIA